VKHEKQQQMPQQSEPIDDLDCYSGVSHDQTKSGLALLLAAIVGVLASKP